MPLDSIPQKVSAVDSVAVDSVALVPPVPGGISVTLDVPERLVPTGLQPESAGMSWVVGGLLLLFVVICLRYRKNSRYLSLLVNDMTEVKVRHNAFDDTLRETAFVWLLNVMMCACAGILLYGAIFRPEAGLLISGRGVGRLGICMGLVLGYTLVMATVYKVVGTVFSDARTSTLWVKGYVASQGLSAILLFPIALLALCLPGMMFPMAVAGGVVFILAKLLFIYKGFCIFFTDSASWVLFLYYLCSLEIVPIVLTYAGAVFLCA